MGNYQCCFSSTRSKPSCLLDQDGNLRRLELPVGAAELMLEFPGHVVSSAADLHRTGRLVALRADDELLAGNLYLMVPVSEINRKVTEAEMAAVESASKKKGEEAAAKAIQDCSEMERVAAVRWRTPLEDQWFLENGFIIAVIDCGTLFWNQSWKID